MIPSRAEVTTHSFQSIQSLLRFPTAVLTRSVPHGLTQCCYHSL